MNLRLTEYQVLAEMAEVETRTPDQQALFLLRSVLARHVAMNTPDPGDNGLASEEMEEVTISE